MCDVRMRVVPACVVARSRPVCAICANLSARDVREGSRPRESGVARGCDRSEKTGATERIRELVIRCPRFAYNRLANPGRGVLYANRGQRIMKPIPYAYRNT